MADDKRGRERKARKAERRQIRREIEEELERMDESEPPIPPEELADVEVELQELSYPVTGSEVVDTAGDTTLEGTEKTYQVMELIPDTNATFESPAAVREEIKRPTVAAAMKRIGEASDDLSNGGLSSSQYNTYRKTLVALKEIKPDDNDEGVAVITDWILTHIEEKENLPKSRAVRRRAAKFCRNNGYEIPRDEWMGV